jgi:hypothetical protein
MITQQRTLGRIASDIPCYKLEGKPVQARIQAQVPMSPPLNLPEKRVQNIPSRDPGEMP